MKTFLNSYKALSFCVLLFTTSLLNAATYTVTSTANGTNTDGISLRWAITQANTGVGNIIAFNIPGMAPHTITLTSALPVLSKDNITIDGSTQPANGYTGTSPKIIINGNNAISKGIEASPTKDDMKIYGLYIKGFTDYAIYFPGKETHIIGAIGKGNVISGNGNASTDATIYVKGATIKANIIGLDVTGTTAEANTGYGIQASGGVCIIGGANVGEGNVISANTNHGIYFTNCDNSIIKGNKIGTDSNGANDLGNGGNGIYITVNSNNVEIGGTAEGEGNVISGNTLSGINNDGGNDLIVKGNKIGTDITGTLNIGNTGNGITLTTTATMGTIEANVISGNAIGIYISGADNGIIKNNKIGTDITGTQNIGNTDYGIFITNNADSHQIGGTGTTDGNIIAYNGNSGIGIDANGGILTDNNIISRNSIFCNANTGNTLGIALVNNGNDGIAAPVITTANPNEISGTAVANSIIEIFEVDTNCIGAQGKLYIGTTTTDANGNWVYTASLSGVYTATATLANKGTSEFASERLVDILMICVSYNGGSPSCCHIGPCTLITICVGAEIELYASLDRAPINTTDWDFHGWMANQTTIGGIFGPITFNTPGTYNISATGNTIFGPAGSDIFQIVVIPNPVVADFTSSTPTCVNSDVCFINTTNSPYDLPNYATWDYGDGSPKCNSPLLSTCMCHKYSSPGVYTVTLSVDYFGCKDEVSHEVTIIPAIDLIANNLCLGSSTLFTIDNPCNMQIFTVDWDFGDGNFLTQVAPFPPTTNHTYGATGTYNVTITVYDLDNNPTTKTITITIDPAPTVTASADLTSICTGACTNISAIGSSGATFTWNSGQTGVGPHNVCPTSTTNYIVTATLPGGCVAMDDVTITVNPPPTAIAGSDVTICAGETAQLGSNFNAGNISNIWTPTTGLSCTDCVGPIANPTTTTIYTLNTTSAEGCTASDQVTVTVIDCACTTSATITINAPGDVASNYPSGFTNDMVDIAGTFTIDQPFFIIDASNVRLAPNAKVDVLAGNTLIITNTSHLFTCSDMWDGIYVQPGGNLIVEDNSSVEDALNAIVSIGGGDFKLENAIFNKNFKHVVVQTFGSNHSASVTGTQFTCKSSVQSAGNTLKAPKTGQRTFIGIEVTDVNFIEVGDILPNPLNLFDNMDIGIRAIRSDINIVNNKFTNIKDITACPPFTTCPPEGIAIWTTGTAAAAHALEVGGNHPDYLNVFEDCTFGIVAETNISVEINVNTFTRVTNGIFITGSTNPRTIQVLNNSFDDYIFAVNCIDNNASQIEINDNTFTTPPIKNTLAIGVREVTQANIDVDILRNQIEKTLTGIWVTNIGDGQVNINDNRITDVTSVGISIASYGIRVENVNHRAIKNNYIFPTVAATPTTAAARRGIDITLSPGVIENNLIDNMGRGITCRGTMNLAPVKCNTITNCIQGVELDNATIGDQGSASNPSDNQWFNTPAGGLDIFSNGGGVAPDWYYRGSPTSYDVFPFTIGGINDIIVGGSPVFNCPAPPVRTSAEEELQQKLTDMIQNPIVPITLQNEHKFFSTSQIYAQLKQNPVLLNLGTAKDSIVQNFYDSVSVTCIGKLSEINDELCQKNCIQAATLNSSFTAHSLIEENQKAVNTIYITANNAANVFTTAQVTELEAIAVQCPLIGGTAVYSARVMLQLATDSIYDYPDTLCAEPQNNIKKTNFPNRFDNQQLNKQAESFNLYPNPNNGMMQLDYTLEKDQSGELVIFDITGKLINRYPLKEENKTFGIHEAALENGIYFYKVVINNQTVKTDKLIIIK